MINPGPAQVSTFLGADAEIDAEFSRILANIRKNLEVTRNDKDPGQQKAALAPVFDSAGRRLENTGKGAL